MRVSIDHFSRHTMFTQVCFPDFSTIDVQVDTAHISPSCVLPDYLCAATAADTFLVSVASWATVQLSWTIVLLITQLWQVARQMTTLEVSNLGRYGWMGGRGGGSMHAQQGHTHHHAHGQGSESDADAHRHKHSGMCCGGGGFLMNLLGFDRFTKGKAADGLARSHKAPNPFHLGVVGNCKDFWTAGRELGVEYDKLYDVPLEGFQEAKRRRLEDGDHEDGGRKSLRASLLMKIGLGGRGSRAGYEPLSQV
jgi:palmitoyltransferase ZDHHC13/17